MPWSPELRAKVGLSRAGILRKVTPAEGQVILAELGLTPEETAEALSICRQPKQQPMTIVVTDPSRKIWLVAAWLLGASWRQLGMLHGIAHTSVMQSAKKAMTPQVIAYTQAHGRPQKLNFDRLEIMRRIFLDNKAIFSSLDPSEVARRLDEMAASEGD